MSQAKEKPDGAGTPSGNGTRAAPGDGFCLASILPRNAAERNRFCPDLSRLVDQAIIRTERHLDAAAYFQQRAAFHIHQAEQASRIRRTLEGLVVYDD